MALYACINCGNKVSSEGVNCPKCGYPIAKTIDETEKTKKKQQLREKQLANIEAAIHYYKHKIELALKAYEEVTVLSKISSAVADWEEHLRKKTENYPDAEKVLDAIQKRFPVEYEEIKEEVYAEFLNKMAFSANDEKGESIKCPECGTTYSANLVECPSCGWTANRKLAEDLRRVEQARSQTFLKRLSNMLSDKCKEIRDCYGVLSPEAAKSKSRGTIAYQASLMESLCNEIKGTSNFDVLDYSGKVFRIDDESIEIKFYPRGYAQLWSYGRHSCELIEASYAKERHISCESVWEEWSDSYERRYRFDFSYQDAIALIEFLSRRGYSTKISEEMSIDYLNGFEISKGTRYSKLIDRLEAYPRDSANVVMPNSVEEMYPVFGNHKNLKSIVLSSVLQEIPDHAFLQCVNLMEVVIFPSVNKIGDLAFKGCEKVKFIIIEENGKTSVESQIYAKIHGIPYERLTPTEYSARREEEKQRQKKLKEEEEERKRLEEERAETKKLLQTRKEALDRKITLIIKQNEKIRRDAQNVPAVREREERRSEYTKAEQELNRLGIFGFVRKKELKQKLELLEREMERLRGEEPRQRDALLATINDSLSDKEKERNEIEQAIKALERQDELNSGRPEENTSRENSSAKLETSKKGSLNLDEKQLAERARGENLRQLLHTDSHFGIQRGHLFRYEDKDVRGCIEVPTGVMTIGIGAFYGCKKLKSIAIPDSVISIEGLAFKDCESLESIIIPNSVVTIGSSAFEGCIRLESVVVCDGVLSIDSSAFSGCKNLKNITLPSSVIRIGPHAFSGCESLESISVPDRVEEIGGGAFGGCEKLVICVRADSYAHTYMKENRNVFEEIGGSRTSKSFRVRKKDPQPTFKFETTYENACRDEVKSSYDYIGGLKTEEEAVQFAMERMERGEYD